MTWVPIAAGGMFYAATVARVLLGVREEPGLERNLLRRVDDPQRTHALTGGDVLAPSAAAPAFTQQALVD